VGKTLARSPFDGCHRYPARMTDVRTEGPTPAGGAYSIGSYLDDDGNPVEPEQATQLLIREFDSADRMIAETWGEVSAATAER
jgi:hypothetical protein